MLINFKFRAFVLAIFMAIFPVRSAAVKVQETTEKKVQAKKEGNPGLISRKAIRVILSTAILASYDYMFYRLVRERFKPLGISICNKLMIAIFVFPFKDFSFTTPVEFKTKLEKTITSLLLIGNLVFNIIF